MFNLNFTEGNPVTALSDIHSLVISRSMATAFFGTTDPLGKTLRMNNADRYTITGVFDDLPANTSFRFKWLGDYRPFTRTTNGSRNGAPTAS